MKPHAPEKKIALVTGSTTGLGFAIAEKLASAGYIVILNGRSQARVRDAQKRLKGESFGFHADVSAVGFTNSWKKFSQKIKLNRLDVVIHNAGINHIGSIARTQPLNVVRTFDTNTFSIYRVAQATQPFLENSDDPHFVYVSSLMQHFAVPQRSVYAASKRAAEIILRTWIRELAKEKSRIRVQILRPAGIETGFHENTATDGTSKHSTLSRMSAEKIATYAVKLLNSKKRSSAPGFVNALAGFIGQHFERLADYLASRRY